MNPFVKQLMQAFAPKLAEKGIEVKFTDSEQKMISADLQGGGTISTPSEEWVPGVPVLDEAGNPVADGEYILADGGKVEVSGGVLVELYPAAPATEEMSAEETAEALEIIAAEQAAQIENLTEEKTALETTVAESTAKVEQMSKQVEELKAQVAKLAKLPAATSVKHSRDEKSEEKPLTRGQQILKRFEKKKNIFGNGEI
jgi:hypothetical protein